MRGTIRLYFSARGFGFIQNEESKDIFFHISRIENPLLIEKGMPVDFTLAKSRRGLEATDIVCLEEI